MDDRIATEELSRLGAFVAATMGLDFPPQRWPDLRRGIAAAARELGFDEAGDCARRLMSAQATRAEVEALAAALTVGETYFFRDKLSFDVLAKQIVPDLLKSGRGRRLRIWSAGCCTGEEPYSIAMILRETIPDIERWDVSILATDINARFLGKAAAGVFGRWSFRDAPPSLVERCFHPLPGHRFQIRADIQRMVRFAPLNLAEEAYPSSHNDTGDMDVIFCRNVLMYFTAPQARSVVERFHRSQPEGGWLFVSPSELPHLSFPPYVTANAGGVILCRKETGNRAATGPRQQGDDARRPIPLGRPTTPVAVAARPIGKPAEARRSASGAPHLARSLANEGRLVEALMQCDDWIAKDKLNPAAHYLRGDILTALDDIEDAATSLRRTLYLDPEFVLAHFALGNLARDRGDVAEADLRMRNVLVLLSRLPDAHVLPESDGLTAGQFAQIVDSLIGTRGAA